MTQDVSYEQKICALEQENQQLKDELEKYKRERLFLSRDKKEIETLKNHFYHSPGFIFISHLKDGIFAEVNDAFCKISGFSRNELIGKSSVELGIVSIESRRKLIDHIQKKGIVKQQEMQVRAKTGDIKDIYFSAQVLELSGENYIVSSGMDITEYKNLLVQIGEREKQLSFILENSRDGIHLTDLKANRYVFVSKAQEKLTGFTREELEFSLDEAAARLHPDDVESVNAYLSAVISGQEPDDPMEYRWKVKSGEFRWFSDSRKVIQDDEGNAAFLVGISRDITERKKTEHIQRENDRQFRQLADAMPHLVWITRPDGYHEYFNERWYEFTNTEPGETYGHLWATFLHPDDYERSVEVWNRSLKTGEPYSIEYRFKRGKDGTYHWFLGRAMPVYNDQGEITRWFGTCTNIQELKEAQQEAQENYERYQLVNLATHDIIWDWNLITNHLSWNKVVEKAIDTSLEEMHHAVQSWHDHIHPEDRDRVINSINKAIEKGENIWSSEYRFGPTEDVWRTYLDRGFIARDNNGKAYRMIGSMLDLTEQIKAEEAIRKNEHLLKNVLEALPVGVFVSDEKGKLAKTNSVAEKIWGGAKHVPIDQLHEYNGWWRHSGEKIEAMDWALARAFLKGETSVNEEIDIECFDGSRKTILNSAVPVKNEKGDIISAVAVNSDITQKIKDEEALRESNERLKIAGELHENLLYIIAHDLRSPMANMRLILDLINKENNANSKIQMMGTLGEMLNRQENILEGLADLIKVQSPEEIKPSEINLLDVVNDIIRENEVALTECEGIIHVDFDTIPKIIYVQSFIYSILKNLITNAIKYRDHNRKLVVDIQTSQKNGLVLITVKDNGIGFDLQKHGKDLFRPFKRFTKQASGTGIGLYIIKHLIVKNGGHIDVESEPGKGSGFYCYFKEYK